LLPAEKRSELPELLRQACTSGVRSESQLRRQDGTLLPVQLSLSSIPLEECGRGICVVAADVSEQKRVEEEVRRLNVELEKQVSRRTAELQAANQELEAFNYAVAHDLRAPVRHIHGFSDILDQDAASTLSADGRHALDCIRTGTLRMERLLESLLNLSRFGRQAVHRENVPLKQLVEDVIADLTPEIVERQIEWKIGNLPAVDCDPALMKIVFANLLSNAVKFTRPRSVATIEIGQQMRKGERVLFVRDNGAGFDMKYADQLFGVFQRLHHDKDFEGTGVGLATAHRILQKHGGTIWAEAGLDKGATFYFTCEDKEVIREHEALALEAM
jgi:light-regulated signal transduction histidine kinase (bacteriophytochrome)